MDTVFFRITRKADLRGALIPCDMYINGESLGRLGNGKSAGITLPRAKFYYIEDYAAFFHYANGYLADNGADEYTITIGREGGWLKNSQPVLYFGDKKLPALDFTSYYEAMNDAEKFQSLSRAEQILVRAYTFYSLSDEMGVLLYEHPYHEIMVALREIGAMQYHAAVTDFIAKELPDIGLPLSEEDTENETIAQKLEQLNELLHQPGKADAAAEFRRCFVRHIVENIL